MSIADFENEIVTHCAPTIMGLKPANLVSFSKMKWPNIQDLLMIYEKLFSQYGIQMKVVCSCKLHYLLLIYRADLLENYLSDPEVESFLIEEGYENCENAEDYIECLALRYGKNQQCPHEIGIFLGYPLEDVKGFIKYKGNQFKYCGIWKVYGDVNNAIETFTAYRQCCQIALKALQNGYGITQLLDNKQLFKGGY